ncbi:di-trans,poly-cis-decaprenylcistransferase [Helicobacter enhydrae]|uniref:Isoprenyl transferase n=1 Tax=Helicobacter enhydrae TaxID=222136 RepID=A0A1B1U7J0_9HELI|nr:di-trans,poly-cis-decaprenylcistransferase [Helicobacter enhydrae]
MDGNGRWATNQGKRRVEGHKKGVEVVREITQWSARSQIETLTLYAFSTENWRRPQYEVEFLMKMLHNFLKSELETYMQNNIRFFAIGDLSNFSKPLQKQILEVQEATQNNTALNQVLALNYGARDEIARAVLKSKQALAMAQGAKEVEQIIEDSLDTQEFGDVDLLIRTGGEQRLSNFLLWQCFYAELFFSPTLWPDFNVLELESIVDAFHQRSRRFGGL